MIFAEAKIINIIIIQKNATEKAQLIIYFINSAVFVHV